MDRSEVLRGAFMEYAKSLGLVKEEVQETITQFRPYPRKPLGLASSAAHECHTEQ
jgi:hypothetical protein